MRLFFFLGLIFTLVTGQAMSAEVKGACTAQEKWELGADLKREIPPDAIKDFNTSLTLKDHPLRDFANALTIAKEPGLLIPIFAQYWMARTFWKAGLSGPAIIKFNELLAEAPTSASLPFQIAAMACLEKLHDSAAVPVFHDRTFENLPAYFTDDLVPRAAMPTVWEAGVHLFMRRLKAGAGEAAITPILKLMDGAGYYEDYVQAVWLKSREKNKEALAPLSRLASATDLPPSIRRRQNELRLLLARTLYEQESYAEGSKVLDLVSRQDNAFVTSLYLKAWLDLGRDKHAQAIGTAFDLQSGALKDTFAPESLLVATIALFDFCQYPSALRTLDTFKKNYETSYQWLKKYAGKTQQIAGPLYPRVVAYLKGEPVDVPERIVSEWIRSPGFLKHQQAINVSFTQSRLVPLQIEKSEQYVANKVAEIEIAAARTQESVLETVSEEMQFGTREVSSDPITDEVRELRDAGILLERLNEALPIWKRELGAYGEWTALQRDQILERIETLFQSLNERMLVQIEGVVEDTEILEAEIWNEAGADMVWQNAHADDPAPVAKGRARTRRADGKQEVWEDELGAKQISFVNHCARKAPAPKRKKETGSGEFR